jgi:pimeloyl-ACP methyl ester carboxylesterase
MRSACCRSRSPTRAPAATAKIAQLVPGARLVSLPTGHQAAIEQPGAFAEAWRAFVAGVRA